MLAKPPEFKNFQSRFGHLTSSKVLFLNLSLPIFLRETRALVLCCLSDIPVGTATHQEKVIILVLAELSAFAPLL